MGITLIVGVLCAILAMSRVQSTRVNTRLERIEASFFELHKRFEEHLREHHR